MKILLPLVLGGLILWWMYHGLDWSSLLMTLQHDMRWEWMVVSLPFGITAQWFRALRWRQALKPLGYEPRHSTATNAIFLSYATSLVVPRVGEVLRCGVLSRYDNVPFSRSLGTVVTERVVDMLIVLLLSAAVFVMQIPVFLSFFEQTGMSLGTMLSRFTGTGYIVTATCVVVIILMGFYLMHRLNWFAKQKHTLLGLWDGLLSVRKVDSPLLYIMYSLGIWVSYFLHFYLTFFCFDFTEGLGFQVALVAFVVGTFAVLVPTPNGAGSWHFAVKTVLMLYGVASESGALFALVVHTIQTALVALLGVVAALCLPTSKNKYKANQNILL
ncbi:MAG: flippase-like domain-containing protein [Bacteroidaceae bacterium]|nr:flippase-like domain-containing protein [Bacteroidaceae bacterium]